MPSNLNQHLSGQERRLLPEAQKVFDEGLKSVAQQDWRSAARSFEETQKLGGHDSRILLNLGLARAKAGQIAPGAAWLDAYLASVPDVANADAVRTEIVRLKRVLLQKADDLFDCHRESIETVTIRCGHRAVRHRAPFLKSVGGGSGTANKIL